MKCIVTLLISALSVGVQVAQDANSGYKTEEGRARVAKTLAASDCDGKQKPQELVGALKLKLGKMEKPL